MCDEIMHAVAGHHFSSVTAVLDGYCRRAVKGEAYPAIISEPDSRVEGVLYLKVNQLVWKKLDEYEGELYSRYRVNVELNAGRVLQAETYVLKPHYHRLLTENEWDYEQFLHYSKRRYLESL